MKRTLLSLTVLAGMSFAAIAQDNPAPPPTTDTLTGSVSKILGDLELLKRVKISGYLQPQFQIADSSGEASFAGGNFSKDVDKRFMMRRGRVKVEYIMPLSTFVFQMDMSEKGFAIKDCYARFTEPWLKTISLQAGMMNRPFGFEIGYSSSLRESPERGRMSQILFPNERDLGAQIIVQAPKTSKWNMLKWEFGWFNGTGAPGQSVNISDFDYQKDFITHLSINKANKSEKFKFGFGVSYYDGGFRKGTKNVYSSGADSLGAMGFILDRDTVPGDAGKIADRKYMGVDAQFNIDWIAGLTTIRGEYIMGQQPGTSSTTVSPNAQPTTDCYIRNFNGAYIYFLQNIMQTKWQLVVKYDWYDPNTDVAGDDLGKSTVSGSLITSKTTKTDVKYTTLGLGLVYHWDTNVKLTAYYDMVTNETSKNLSGYTKDITDNVFTLRLQYKF